jgi:uroporphyrin-3 C-methyltransferase
MSDSAPEARPSSPSPGRGRLLRILDPALWIAVLALAFAGWQWYEGLGEATGLRKPRPARRPAPGPARGGTGAQASRRRKAPHSSRPRAGEPETAFEALGQEARNRATAYAEIEHVFIASHQLSLAGNMKARTALHTADGAAAHGPAAAGAPQRPSTHRAAEGRARGHARHQRGSTPSSPGWTSCRSRLEARAQPEPQPAASGAADPGAWARFWNDVWAELAQLVRVQRMDPPDAVLLAPSHAFFLRENLKLRLIGARLALLSRDAASYKADLKAARDWLNRYFSTRDNSVAHALATLRNLHDAAVGIDAPEIGATLDAMRNLRAARERGR